MNTLPASLCTLEPQVAAHAAEMFEVLSDPAIYQYEGVPPPSVERLAAGFARKESRVSPDGREQWLNWVVRRPDGALAGYVQATVYADGVACVGYEFASRHWRQGIGSAAVRRMLDELRDTYRVHTFVAVLKSANFRSMGLLTKLGFRPGTHQDAERHEAGPDESTLTMPAGARVAAVHCRRCVPEDFAALAQMLELYQYELSDIWPQVLDAGGRYGYDLARHREGERFHAHVALCDGHYAGFALVAPAAVTRTQGFWMEQFFVLKACRRAGVGRQLARWVFDAHPGLWEVGQMPANGAAQAFWRRVTAEVADGGVTELQVTGGDWQGVVQQLRVARPGPG